jgi:exodeoxyribonuclease VII large subunit
MSSYVFQRPEHMVRDRRQQTDELRMRLQYATSDYMRAQKNRVAQACRSLALLSPVNRVQRALDRFTVARRRLIQAAAGNVQRMRACLQPVQAQLNALSPLAILSRGYAIAWKLPERVLVRDADQLAPGDKITLAFGKGGAAATVEKIEEGTNG